MAIRTPAEDVQKLWRAQMEESLPATAAEVNARIQRLLLLLNTYSPLRMLLNVALRNSIFDPEQYLVGRSENAVVRSEYALSLAASVAQSAEKPEPPDEVVEEFTRLVEEVLDAVNFYFVAEATTAKYTPPQSEARMQMITQTLNIRGESRVSHALDLVRALFSPHDIFLKEKTGFATEDFVRAASAIARQVVGAFTEYVAFTQSLRRTIDRSTQTMTYPSKEEATKLADTMSALSSNPFEIQPAADVPGALLRLLSSAPGDNAAFAGFAKAPGWPTNDSCIFERPLLTIGGRFYAFAPHLVLQNLVSILETLIQKTDAKYFKNSYTKKRGKVLEELAVRYLSALLPGSVAYESVYYPSSECGDAGRCECDALILFGRTLFIVEAKAAAVAPSTRRGGLKSLQSDLDQLIASAQTQGARTRRYIETSKPARFTYADGEEAVTFGSRAELGDIFVVNVTLSHLGALATKLTTAAALGVLKERVWPWTVFINDLRIVSEILDTPAEFIAFLKARLSLHEAGIVTTSDENDLLGAFLAQGLDFTEAGSAGAGMVLLDPSYTRALDRYYLGLDGVVATATKPALDVPAEVRELANGLAASGTFGIEMAAEILALPRPIQQFLAKEIQKLLRKAERGESHDVTIPPQRNLPGMTIIVGDAASAPTWRKRSYDFMKKSRERAARWMLATVTVASDAPPTYAVDVMEDEWRPG